MTMERKSNKSRDNKFDNKGKRPFKKKFYKKPKPLVENKDGLIRLNKYVANAGICSRREADVYIASGNVAVNGKTVTEMGYKVKPGDEVRFDGTVISPEKKMYVLLNKPKNFIVSTSDDKDRRTVMELVNNAANVRIYPVGRLDRSTTGLLLFTNDGDLAKKLTNPASRIKKVYQVSLANNLKMKDYNEISEGFKLNGRLIEVPKIAYINGVKSEIGIEINSGHTRLVRDIFEHFGYTITKLDRTLFSNLTKKNLPRGNWRYLTEDEVSKLRMGK